MVWEFRIAAGLPVCAPCATIAQPTSKSNLAGYGRRQTCGIGEDRQTRNLPTGLVRCPPMVVRLALPLLVLIVSFCVATRCYVVAVAPFAGVWPQRYQNAQL